jgi:hypothetical protein
MDSLPVASWGNAPVTSYAPSVGECSKYHLLLLMFPPWYEVNCPQLHYNIVSAPPERSMEDVQDMFSCILGLSNMLASVPVTPYQLVQFALLKWSNVCCHVVNAGQISLSADGATFRTKWVCRPEHHQDHHVGEMGTQKVLDGLQPDTSLFSSW